MYKRVILGHYTMEKRMLQTKHMESEEKTEKRRKKELTKGGGRKYNTKAVPRGSQAEKESLPGAKKVLDKRDSV